MSDDSINLSDPQLIFPCSIMKTYLLDIIRGGVVQEEDGFAEQLRDALSASNVGVDGLADQGVVEAVATVVEEIKLGITESTVVLEALLDNGVDLGFTGLAGGSHGRGGDQGDRGHLEGLVVLGLGGLGGLSLSGDPLCCFEFPDHVERV